MYSIGDRVVCAGHGAGTVVGIEERDQGGRCREYLTIEVLHHNMNIMLPADKAQDRLRRVISGDAVDEVMEVLRSGRSRMPDKWVARSKRMHEMLGAGDALQVAEVIRDLALRGAEKGLPVGEKQLLSRAQKHLVSELVYACDLSEEEAWALLEGALDPLEPAPAVV
jgi:CarD family transcriptional regulator